VRACSASSAADLAATLVCLIKVGDSRSEAGLRSWRLGRRSRWLRVRRRLRLCCHLPCPIHPHCTGTAASEKIPPSPHVAANRRRQNHSHNDGSGDPDEPLLALHPGLIEVAAAGAWARCCLRRAVARRGRRQTGLAPHWRRYLGRGLSIAAYIVLIRETPITSKMPLSH
jgi:hypothetical protein